MNAPCFTAVFTQTSFRLSLTLFPRDCLHLFYPAAFSSLRLSSPLLFSRPLILEVKYSIHCLSVCGFVLGALWPGETISLSNTRYQKERTVFKAETTNLTPWRLLITSCRRHPSADTLLLCPQTPLTPDWSASSSTWADSATQMLSVWSWSPFFQLTLPSSSPHICPFLSHTALSSPYLSFPLLPFGVIFHVTAPLSPTWDPSQGFLWLRLPQRPKQRDRGGGERERKGGRNPFFRSPDGLIEVSSPSSNLTVMKRRWEMDKGKVEKVEESGEVTKGALIVTERGGGGGSGSLSGAAYWWGEEVIWLEKHTCIVSVTLDEGLSIILGCWQVSLDCNQVIFLQESVSSLSLVPPLKFTQLSVWARG